jgi:sialic acid synthase SpsE
MAVILDSHIIEIHVTLDKSKKFVDNNVSFDFDELKNLVDLIRRAEKIKK